MQQSQIGSITNPIVELRAMDTLVGLTSNQVLHKASDRGYLYGYSPLNTTTQQHIVKTKYKLAVGKRIDRRW